MRTISVVLLAGIVGCAFIHVVSTAEAATFREKVLHSFGAWPDGEVPYAGVINVKGTLYGTTASGGNDDGGTVFALDLNTRSENILYSFTVDQPWANLIDVKGTLYGTTEGGDGGPGTVFALDPSTGAEKTIYTFCSQSNCADGNSPVAALIDVKGMLYGTTIRGGGNTRCQGDGCGTVFSVDPNTGVEKVLYAFCPQAGCADGAEPQGGLIDVNGTLYGTTRYGGGTACNGDGCGTVFAINRKTGKEKTLYAFCSQLNCADGANPTASLIDVNGTLYGTTYLGGSTGCNGNGCGTVFAIDPNTDAETVLYSFCGQTNCADGANPVASLIDVHRILYGTTFNGGNGNGTVFSIDPDSGAETVIYSFCNQQNCADGAVPQGSLMDVSGKLYGTTLAGGTDGYGTVFVLKETQ
jgi:uncharacterized repeat protein (TIGR03803 family)